MKISRFVPTASRLVSSLALLVCASAHAGAAVATWVGTGSSNNFSDAANWGGTVPANGDDIVFSAAAFPARGAPVNDMVSLVVNAINIYEAYNITGNAITCNSINDNNATSATIAMPLTTPGTSAITVTVTTAGATLNLNGLITGAGPVTYGGPGIKRLNPTGVSTLTGLTSLTLGTLRILGSQASSPITVTVGTLVLVNNCTVNNVSVAGGSTSTLSCVEPASALATHGTSASLSVTGGSTFQVVSKGATTALYSNITASAVTLTGGMLTVDTSAYIPFVGAVMRIIDNTSGSPVTGTFAGLVEGATVTSTTNAGSTFIISYVGGTGNDVTLTTSGAAPGTAGTSPGVTTGAGAGAGTVAPGSKSIGGNFFKAKGGCGLGGGSSLIGLMLTLAFARKFTARKP